VTARVRIGNIIALASLAADRAYLSVFK
jgi:hypothetical protein